MPGGPDLDRPPTRTLADAGEALARTMVAGLALARADALAWSRPSTPEPPRRCWSGHVVPAGLTQCERCGSGWW
jgi:hypothetical protein